MFPEFANYFAQRNKQSLSMFERSDSQAHAAIATWIGVPVADQDSIGAQGLNEFRMRGTDTHEHEVGTARPVVQPKSSKFLLQ
jgi:hypothetical protein